MVRSCAAVTCEPRQVREEATVNSAPWVPQGRRAVADQSGRRGERCDRRQVHGRNLAFVSVDAELQSRRVGEHVHG
ncbi:MAG: hypothetical protein HW416_194 [Chloroflexi bacterium]|nr:hypothetical protein [Chloroflexota bacterium]